MKFFSGFTIESERILKKGGVGVIPTDTIYGIVGSVLSRRAVNRIYRLRHRRPDKPMIILIGSLDDLKIFDIQMDDQIRKLLKRFWPGKVSVILSCPSKKFFYLHCGKNQLAFRFPAKKDLLKFLKITGPLVAPSANVEGKPSAKTIQEAKKYFGDQIDFYIDRGKLISKPSTLIEFNKGKISILRQGSTHIRKTK